MDGAKSIEMSTQGNMMIARMASTRNLKGPHIGHPLARHWGWVGCLDLVAAAAAAVMMDERMTRGLPSKGSWHPQLLGPLVL